MREFYKKIIRVLIIRYVKKYPDFLSWYIGVSDDTNIRIIVERLYPNKHTYGTKNVN